MELYEALFMGGVILCLLVGISERPARIWWNALREKLKKERNYGN